MPYEFYKIMHYLGIGLTVVALGGVCLHAINGGDKSTNAFRKGSAISHGIGLVLVLVGGFGMLAKAKMGFPVWSFLKIGIWLAFGALPVLPNKLPKAAKAVFFLIPLLLAAAGAIALYKPFA